MSFSSTMRFLRGETTSGCGPTTIAGRQVVRRTGYAGDVLPDGVEKCYPATRPRAPWGPGGYAGKIGGADSPEYLVDVFCTMRATYHTYRNSHWMTQGYGNHLLFERLYNEVKDLIDTLAEQVVGYYGSNGIREDVQLVNERVLVFARSADPTANALQAALTVRQKLGEAYDRMDADGNLTPGWDDTLTSLAKTNDNHIYLLQQAE